MKSIARLQTGDSVHGEYYDHAYTGTVTAVRLHTINRGQYVVSIALDTPIMIWDENDVRDELLLQVYANGRDTSGNSLYIISGAMPVDVLAVRVPLETAQQYREQIASADELYTAGVIGSVTHDSIDHTFNRPNVNCSNMDIDPVWIAAELMDIYMTLPYMVRLIAYYNANQGK